MERVYPPLFFSAAALGATASGTGDGNRREEIPSFGFIEYSVIFKSLLKCIPKNASFFH